MTASLIVIRATEFIVIAADSCVSDVSDRETGTCCKIVQVGNFVYVPNKFAGHSDSGYYLDQIIKNVGPADSLSVWVPLLTRAIEPALTKALEAQRKQELIRWMEQFETREALRITLAGIENGGVALVNLVFEIKNLNAPNVELEIKANWCPGPDCPGGIAMMLVAADEFKTRFQQENRDYWEGDVERVAKNAEAFVQKAIDEKIPGVGPPISVLVISASGFDWRKSGLCGSQPPEP
jgi:hypothetical protein